MHCAHDAAASVNIIVISYTDCNELLIVWLSPLMSLLYSGPHCAYSLTDANTTEIYVNHCTLTLQWFY